MTEQLESDYEDAASSFNTPSSGRSRTCLSSSTSTEYFSYGSSVSSMNRTLTDVDGLIDSLDDFLPNAHNTPYNRAVPNQQMQQPVLSLYDLFLNTNDDELAAIKHLLLNGRQGQGTEPVAGPSVAGNRPTPVGSSGIKRRLALEAGPSEIKRRTTPALALVGAEPFVVLTRLAPAVVTLGHTAKATFKTESERVKTIVKCGCKKGCWPGSRCGCLKNGDSCSEACICEGACHNPKKQ